MVETIENLVQLADLSTGLKEFAKAIKAAFVNVSGDTMIGDLTIDKENPMLKLTDTNPETQISNSAEIKKNADSLIIQQENNQIEFNPEENFNENNLTISLDKKTKYPILHTGKNFLYGVCNSNAEDEIKQVSIPGIKTLYNGLTIQVYFTNKNTVQENLKLQINGGNSCPIYKNATKLLSKNEHENYCGWKAQTCLSFTYYNATWLLNSNDSVSENNATQEFSGLMSSNDKQKLDNINSKLITYTAATAGWYRIAETPLNIGLNLGLFLITGSKSDYHSSCLCSINTAYAQPLSNGINILDSTHNHPGNTLSPAIDKIRMVYNSNYTGNSAYLEIHTTQDSLPLTIKMIDGYRWQLMSPVDGSVPAEYSTFEKTIFQHSGEVLNFTTIIPTTGWTQATQNEDDYVQTIPIPGILDYDEPFVELNITFDSTHNFENKITLLRTWEKVYEITTFNNGIQVRIAAKPEVAIPIRLKIIRK